MSPFAASPERQAAGEQIGRRFLGEAWTWLRNGEDEQQTAYRGVFATLQCALSAVDADDEKMALAAVGGVLATLAQQRPDIDVMANVRHGYAAAQEAERAIRGPKQ